MSQSGQYALLDGVVIEYTNDGWNEFKKWLDGTYAKLSFAYTFDGTSYHIVGIDGVVRRLMILNKNAASDFEENFLSSGNARAGENVGIGQRSSDASFPVVLSAADILKSAEFTISNRTENTISALNYTVSSGKTFYLSFFGGSAFTPLSVILRLKVAGATKFMSCAFQSTNLVIALPLAVPIATSGQQITVTCEAQTPHGNAWAGFTGYEV